MNIKKAFTAGIIAGAVMVLIMAGARAAGAGADVPMMLGTLPGNGPSGAAWFAGFAVLVIASGIAGIAYGVTFETLTRRADAMTGVLVTISPMAIEGLLLGLMDKVHPLMPETMQSPGFFMSGYGTMGVIGFIVSNLAFGAIVGSLYGPLESQALENPEAMDE
jgi:hypothetical protein